MNLALKALSPYFQKQFNSKKEVVGAEILMRPQVGCITDVIKILEAQNQIHYLDLLAFSHALKFSEKHKIPCSSNFSGKSLSQKKVIDTIVIADLLTSIKIELTENRELSGNAVENIKFLSEFGFKISLDDYGSKYNCLNRFVTLPISEIKIDKYLIDCLNNSCNSSCPLGLKSDYKTIEIIKSIINLAHKLDCLVVAEGVETQEQFEILVSLGCDRFQGFWLHKPEIISNY